MHRLAFTANRGSQEQNYSSCARTVCQDQIIVDFSQLQKQEKMCGNESALFSQVWLLLSPADATICDLPLSRITLAHNNLFHFQFNTCVSKS